MFSCKTAGLRNLLMVCPGRGTSPRPERGVCRVVGLTEHQGVELPFQVGRFGFCLRFPKDVLTAQAARKHLPLGITDVTCCPCQVCALK